MAARIVPPESPARLVRARPEHVDAVSTVSDRRAGSDPGHKNSARACVNGSAGNLRRAIRGHQPNADQSQNSTIF